MTAFQAGRILQAARKDERLAQCTHNEISVLANMWALNPDETKSKPVCFATLEVLAERSILSRKTVIRALAGLKEKGLITWEGRGRGRGLVHRYLTPIPGVTEPPEDDQEPGAAKAQDEPKTRPRSGRRTTKLKGHTDPITSRPASDGHQRYRVTQTLNNGLKGQSDPRIGSHRPTYDSEYDPERANAKRSLSDGGADTAGSADAPPRRSAAGWAPTSTAAVASRDGQPPTPTPAPLNPPVCFRCGQTIDVWLADDGTPMVDTYLVNGEKTVKELESLRKDQDGFMHFLSCPGDCPTCGEQINRETNRCEECEKEWNSELSA